MPNFQKVYCCPFSGTDDKILIGVLVYDNGFVSFHKSDKRINLVKHFSKMAYELIKNSTTMLEISAKNNKIDSDFRDYIQKYSNGVTQFSKPIFAMEIENILKYLEL